MWELRYKRDEFSIEAGRAKGRDYPEWFTDCPELLPFEFNYLRAFWDLRSEAHDGDQTLGRIPWSACREYGAAEFGFGEDMHGNFWLVISSMDNGLRNWHADEYARKVRQSKGNKDGMSSPFQLSQSNEDGTRYGR